MTKKMIAKTLTILLVIAIFFSTNILAANDTQAPTIVYSSPEGFISDSQVTLHVVTDETSECRYGTSDQGFEAFIDILGSNTTNHEKLLSLQDGSYTYYVRCKDQSNNSMQGSESIVFTVDSTSPSIVSSSPDDIISVDYTTLEIVTDEKTICKYDLEDTPYNSMDDQFEDTNSTLHTKDLYSLSAKDHTYFVGCKDYAGNIEYGTVEFTIELPPSFSIDIEKNPPIKEGTYEVEVISSKRLINAPTLEYKFDDEDKKYSVSLIGSNTRWEGYIIIPEFPKNRVGRFIISGKDYDGLTGSRISSGELFLVDTVDPIAPESLNIDTYNEKIEIDWDYDGEKADHYIIFRSRSSGVETVDYYDVSDDEKYIDTEVDAGEEYYYRVSAVDESDNRGELSKEVRITAVGKKEEKIEIPKLSKELEIELNSTIEKLKSDIFDFNTHINSLERLTDDEESLVLEVFDLIAKSKKARDDYQNIIDGLDSLREIDLSKNEFRSKIDDAKDNRDELKKLLVKKVEIVNSVDFQQVSSEKEIFDIHNLIQNRFEMDERQKENFSGMSEYLETDANIYSMIVSTRIEYVNGDIEEYTVFSKDIIVDEARDVWIIEDIPKDVANDANDIEFLKKPVVLKADPVVRWEYKILNELNIQYYVEDIISLDDASKTRTHLVFDPNKFISLDQKSSENDVSSKITGKSIFDKINIFKIINLKDLFMPLMGVFIIAGLLVYYFFFLKEDSLGEEHNLQIQQESIHPNTQALPRFMKENNQSLSSNHTILPSQKLDISDEAKDEVDNYHHLVNMIDHANRHANDLNVEGAKKEYMLIYNLFTTLNFTDEHAKRGVKNKVVEVYNKIMLWQKINYLLANAPNMTSENLKSESRSISMLLSMIHDQNTPLVNYAKDYHTYIEKIKILKK